MLSYFLSLAFSGRVCGMKWDAGNDKCAKPMPEPQFSFNAKKGKCESVHYKGCGGNENYFPNEAECKSYCIDKNCTEALDDSLTTF